MCQAWAEASGAYIPGKDKPDLSTWKRNFRSALNRKEVLRLADDQSKDPFDPHKVYEFVTPGECNQAGLSADLGIRRISALLSTHPLSGQQQGTLHIWTPLLIPMARAVCLIPR